MPAALHRTGGHVERWSDAATTVEMPRTEPVVVMLPGAVLATVRVRLPEGASFEVLAFQPWMNPGQQGHHCRSTQRQSAFRPPPRRSRAGTASIGPGIVALSFMLHPPAGHITAGSTWHFPTWYRDVGGPCGGSSNLSNALAVLFTP